MYLFKKVSDLQDYLNHQKSLGKSIGFAPTMGALHQGHLSLIQASNEENDLTVCSIFVNPTQFNEASDLEKYPRTAAKDIEMLTKAQNDVLFMPPVEEVYPPGLQTTLTLDFGQLTTVMEGRFRPGHFDGMAQVVKRLLDIVQPHHLYMGQKDYQQFTIVQNMIKQLHLEIKLTACPIIREEDGLAMSSRNVRLEKKLREKATILHQTLVQTKEKFGTVSVNTLKEEAMKALTIEHFRPEYFEIVDGYSLQNVEDLANHKKVVACTAVWIGDIRLIDNMILMNKE